MKRCAIPTAKLLLPLCCAGLLLACSAPKPSPERKRADAQQVFNRAYFVPLCIKDMERRGVAASRAQIRQACGCVHSGVVRHYGTPEKLAQTSLGSYNQTTNGIVRKCAAQVKGAR